MRRDPIMDVFSMWFHRCTLFLLLSLLTAFGLWCWLLMAHFDVAVRDLIGWARAAWTPAGSKIPAVFAYGALAIGTLTTSVVYLVIGQWWKRRGDVHRRGARFDSQEA